MSFFFVPGPAVNLKHGLYCQWGFVELGDAATRALAPSAPKLLINHHSAVTLARQLAM
jgi:hypothetical protein